MDYKNLSSTSSTFLKGLLKKCVPTYIMFIHSFSRCDCSVCGYLKDMGDLFYTISCIVEETRLSVYAKRKESDVYFMLMGLEKPCLGSSSSSCCYIHRCNLNAFSHNLEFPLSSLSHKFQGCCGCCMFSALENHVR